MIVIHKTTVGKVLQYKQYLHTNQSSYLYLWHSDKLLQENQLLMSLKWSWSVYACWRSAEGCPEIWTGFSDMMLITVNELPKQEVACLKASHYNIYEIFLKYQILNFGKMSVKWSTSWRTFSFYVQPLKRHGVLCQRGIFESLTKFSYRFVKLVSMIVLSVTESKWKGSAFHCDFML